MPDFKDTFGGGLVGQAASSALGAAMGLALEGHNDRRQIKQQQKLQDMQIAGSKQMTDYNYAKQLQMWKDTNYGAQMEELKKAGLNPGLIYGMSGGGGVTTGSGGGQVSGGQAASVSGETGMGLQMALQAQMTQAQIELAKSQANLNNVDAAKRSGVDTELTKTQTQSLLQGITDSQVRNALTEAETALKQLQIIHDQGTLEDRIDRVAFDTQKALEELNQAQVKTYIDRATKENQIKIVKETAIGSALNNTLTKAKTELARSDIQVNDQQIKQMASAIEQKWRELDQNDTKLAIEAFKAEIEANYPGVTKTIGRFLDDGLEQIFGAFGKYRPKLKTINK